MTKDNNKQLVSADSSQELFQLLILPYLGVSRTEFQFCCLRIRFVSQGVVCFRSVDLGIWNFLDFFGDFLQCFLWFHLIYLFVYVIYLSGT